MKTKEMLYAVLFTALVIVFGYVPAIPIPLLPVPITIQTLGVMIAGSVLGSRLGALSMFIFVLLAAIGLPVLTGGTGGLLRPSGGFVISWPVAAYLIGYFVERYWERLTIWKLFLVNLLGGVIVVYAIGIPYLAVMADLDLVQAVIASAMFIPGDLIKAYLAAMIAIKLHKAYPLIKK